MWKIVFLFLTILFGQLSAEDLNSLKSVPVSYKGRIRSFDSYAKLLLYEFTHDHQIEDQKALNWLVDLYYHGFQKWANTPLFWVEDEPKKRLSYNELKLVDLKNPELLKKIKLFESFKGILHEDSNNFLLLPNKYSEKEWLPLSTLNETDFNFTAFSDSNFRSLKRSYLNWKNGNSIKNLSDELLNAYQEISATEMLKGRAVYYPSLWQLKAEVWALDTPLISFAIFGYLLALFCFLIPFPKALFLGYSGLIGAFCLHTTALLLRSYILWRPPVSNMFETVIYVPWVAILVSGLLVVVYKTRWPLIASCILTSSLLAILELTNFNNSYETVPAVLNSQFWLVIHVLMIVGSFGILLLSGILGHLYIICYHLQKAHLSSMENCLLQTLYLGLALLIPGTLLGGVWAAQSWGRFWDWDPKESWAFISACIYLITVHLYRFKCISAIGLSIGSIIGLGFISFTWYGVNYILGTGLHSYGFGKASHALYWFFLAAEAVFLILMIFLSRKPKISIEKKT